VHYVNVFAKYTWLLKGTIVKEEDLLNFAELGSYCQFDLFGIECSYYQLDTKIDMPSDAQRIDKMRILKDDGRLDRILMSHDIHTKHRLVFVETNCRIFSMRLITENIINYYSIILYRCILEVMDFLT
jgi:predicted metal-dependent phosphotriesterase family hydrolase